MKKVSLAALLFIALSFSSCEAIGDIFKTGVWTGVIIVVIIIALIIWLVSRMGGKK